MTLIGEVFVADVLGKAVLDPVGEEIGRHDLKRWPHFDIVAIAGHGASAPA